MHNDWFCRDAYFMKLTMATRRLEMVCGVQDNEKKLLSVPDKTSER